jgi:hypothetical protein
MSDAAVKVVYILGWGRSGSTLLDNLLGSVKGFFSTGELHSLWQGGLVEQRRCGCGVPVPQCGIWKSVLGVLERTYSLDVDELVRCRRRTIARGTGHRLLRRDESMTTADRAVRSYARVTQDLYKSIAEVTRARVIVDSSKVPAIGALLRSTPEVDPYFVHLVRDPRAVAHSWRRRKEDPDREFYSEMERYHVFESACKWIANNRAANEVCRRHGGDRSLLVRYEDAVARPPSTVRTIVDMTGEVVPQLPFLDDGVARLGPNHTVSGNPARFETGAVPIVDDSEWMDGLAKRDQLLTTALSLPVLGRYGYPVIPRARKVRRPLEPFGSRVASRF